MQTTSDDAEKCGAADADLVLANAGRREFLIRSAAGGGLMVGAAWLGVGGDATAQSTTTSQNLNAWIIVASDDTVTLQVSVTEMGQGTSTGLAQIAADELCLAWNKIKVIHAPVDPVHGGVNAGPYGRFTGGSLGIRLFSPTMQQAAANARQLLLMAAASIWRVDVSTCTAKLGVITCGTGTSLQSLTYGKVAATAATLRLSANVALNQTPKVFTGTAAKRLDIPAKVDGSAKFGIDVFIPGMVFAAVKHCPTIGGTVGSVGSNPAGALAIVKVGGAGTTGSAN